MRKIAHVISTPEGIGGAERVMLALMRGGAERGWEQVVLNPFDVTPESSAIGEVLGPELYEAAGFSHRDLWRARSWCFERLRDSQPQIVHAHMAHAGLIVATLKLRVPKVLSHHPGDYFSVHQMRLRGAADRWAARRYDCVVAVSGHVQRFLSHRYRIAEKRIVTIPNGWEGDPLPRALSAEPRVVIVGNLRQGKGHETLVAAFRRVVDKIPEARLMVVGDGPLRLRVERLARALLPERNVTFLGAIDDVWPVLAHSDLLVLPSTTETAGIAAMEAMAAGLPVVASAVGGLPELVEDNRTGLLVEPGREEALADAIVKVLQLPDRGKAWGEAGRKVAQRFTAERMVESYFGLYERLISAKGNKTDG